jgi:hypothetical protein
MKEEGRSTDLYKVREKKIEKVGFIHKKENFSKLGIALLISCHFGLPSGNHLFKKNIISLQIIIYIVTVTGKYHNKAKINSKYDDSEKLGIILEFGSSESDRKKIDNSEFFRPIRTIW